MHSTPDPRNYIQITLDPDAQRNSRHSEDIETLSSANTVHASDSFIHKSDILTWSVKDHMILFDAIVVVLRRAGIDAKEVLAYSRGTCHMLRVHTCLLE